MHSAKVRFLLSLFIGLGMLLSVSGCAKKQVKQEKTDQGALAGAQDAALKGQDIALEDANLNFVEPQDKTIFAEIYFDYDSSNIQEKAKPTLASISGWMNSNASKHILIEGHCDERGTKEFNLALGEQRSLSVRRYLVGLGIEPKRLHTISYGEERPAQQGHNEAAWSKNRRAHFLISE